jgi:hypothetical protein
MRALAALTLDGHCGKIASGWVGWAKAAMSGTSASISVTHRGHELLLPPVVTSAHQVGEMLRTYAGASDVTVLVTLPDEHGTVLMALEAGSAFVGLQTQDGIYQYAAGDTAEGECEFIIRGQPTVVQKRYVLPAATAIELLLPWLAGADPLAALEWERQ